MWKQAMAAAVVGVLVSVTPASAQRVEVSGIFGWAFSDGISSENEVLADDGNIYNRVDPKDSAAWGFSVGYLASPNAEFGFIFNQQMSKLQVDGTNTREIGDLSVNTYHGYFAYNFGEPEATIRPYAMIGLGATNFGSVDFELLGIERQTESETQFSTTWGAGVKMFTSPNFGIRVGAHWTPTYIKTDTAGWWCDPFWGCYLVGDAQYANQLQISGGVTVRF